MMAAVEQVEVVLANNDRVTLRVGDMFLKIDADQTRTDVEVEAIAMAPVPTPEILWRKQPVLAVAALPGRALGRVAGNVARVAGGVGRGRCCHPDAARRTAAAMARAERRHARVPVGRWVRLARRE